MSPLIVLTIAVSLIVGWAAGRRRAAYRQMRAEFARKFPSKCFDCSQRRAALRDGVKLPALPHDCKEAADATR